MGLLASACSSLLLILVLAMGLQCLAIQPMTSRLTFGTTFGRPANDHPNSNNQTIVNGKICKSETDCSNLPNTSCIKSPRENNMKRCFCGDRTSPKNGVCKAKQKVPGFPCNEDHECVEGAECTVSNQTHAVTGVSGRQCICRLGEDDDECNGAILTAQLNVWSFLLMVCFSFFGV